jgi:hypothetical protein
VTSREDHVRFSATTIPTEPHALGCPSERAPTVALDEGNDAASIVFVGMLAGDTASLVAA